MSESKQKISPAEVYRRGEEIYATIKDQYEPQYKGKFLVIEIESGKAYMDEHSGNAAERAMMENPGKIYLHTVRIGYDFLYTIAS